MTFDLHVQKRPAYSNPSRYNTTMKHLPEHYYKAFYARDPRYDGVFFTGVTSTGIYCRPVCRARKPKRENCVFFESAAQAELAQFRPCLICRPELAPALRPAEQQNQIHCASLSERQRRRNTKANLGATPKQIQRTQQLLLAKQLLTDTAMSVTDVAFGAGFGSVRRFNQVFKQQYQLTPSSLRQKKNTVTQADWINLTLGYRPPYRWQELLVFLGARTIPGVEHITDTQFSRTLLLGTDQGEIKVCNNARKNQLNIAISSSLIKHIAAIIDQAQFVFDTRAQPDLIAEDLIRGGIPGDFDQFGKGLRVPGSFSGFELAVRAIVGQQVTVKAATTLSRRFCDRFCQTYNGLQPELNRLPVQASTIAGASVDDIASLGIIARRAEAIITLAQRICDRKIQLEPGADAVKISGQLQDIKGIGPWTAHYIALRSLAWPDAFPKEDIILRKALGKVTAKQAEALSQPWRPWRSYASLYLWKTAHDK